VTGPDLAQGRAGGHPHRVAVGCGEGAIEGGCRRAREKAHLAEGCRALEPHQRRGILVERQREGGHALLERGSLHDERVLLEAELVPRIANELPQRDGCRGTGPLVAVAQGPEELGKRSIAEPTDLGRRLPLGRPFVEGIELAEEAGDGGMERLLDGGARDHLLPASHEKHRGEERREEGSVSSGRHRGAFLGGRSH
jgi:hypothetical protein